MLFTANTNTTTLQFPSGTRNAAADPLVDTVSVVLQPPRSFETWQASHFNQTQLDNPSISGFTADPDHDGIADGLKFIFNTDPLTGIPLAQAAALLASASG